MELLVLLFLFVLNGFFSMSEMAVVSARKARLQQLHDEGHAAAGAALELANNPGHFLSTIQVGITVIGIGSGVFGEAKLSAQVAQWLAQWPLLAPHAEGIAVTLVIAGITLGSLVIGELVPKRLALVNPEAVASFAARPMGWLTALVYPIVRGLSAITDGVLKLLGRRDITSPPVTEEEIRVLMEQGTEAGVFEEHEHQLVSRVFRMDELRSSAIMTPRTDLVYLNLDDTREALVARMAESPHSLFPVVRGDLDTVEGIVSSKELLVDLLKSAALDLQARLVKPLYIPESLTVTEVLRAFKQHRQTMALIVNEYGELQGLVTLHDVLEALVGDIGHADEEGDADVVKRADGSLLIDGGVGIDRLKQALSIEEALPEEDTGTYNTLGGFVMLQLGRVPQVADSFEWGGYRFEVVDMDRNRVDRLLVSRIPAPAPAEPLG
ncbi:MAG TPA: hemolysin family protein [Burkholderiales bacterium]|nr:hemolysin family protein [Burkholderiales bacterium]